MYIVLGASGQVGAAVTEHLLRQGKKVRAIVRNPKKAAKLEEAGAEIAVADATDKPALLKAFEGGTTAFLLTPENPGSTSVIGETKKILSHYRSAVEETGIRKVVCLSSIGAQHASGTGNLVQSYLLENTFPNHPSLQQLFVRPSYYYSNWLRATAGDQERESPFLLLSRRFQARNEFAAGYRRFCRRTDGERYACT